MDNLTIYEQLELKNASMVLSFSGWMDGGDVSTGTVEYLKEKLEAGKVAEINPQNFYIFNMPGTMSQVAQFRPHCKIEDGLLVDFQYPKNEFFCSKENNLILFSGKEPNLHWDEYVDCIFEVGEKFNVRMIYFIGSVAGAIPHTREVRISSSLSDEKRRKELQAYDVRFSNYEGPASITTLLTSLAEERGIEIINFVAEIPVYVQSQNPKGIKAIMRRLVKLLNIDIDLNDLSERSDEFERNINELVKKQPKLSEQIRKLEENYDKEFFNRRGDFEEWLRQHGIDKL